MSFLCTLPLFLWQVVKTNKPFFFMTALSNSNTGVFRPLCCVSLSAWHCQSTAVGLCHSHPAGGSQKSEWAEVSNSSVLVVDVWSVLKSSCCFCNKHKERSVILQKNKGKSWPVKPLKSYLISGCSGCNITGVCQPDNPATVTVTCARTHTH